MILNFENTIRTIEALLEKGDHSSLTYAALEARLALERACYDRLRNSHDYISLADIQRWQPAEIIRLLATLVDESITQEVVLSIGRRPLGEKITCPTIEDYEATEFVEVGRQSRFNIKTINKLWNALSKLALHAEAPLTKDSEIPLYGDETAIRSKVLEALEQIKLISQGTMLMQKPDQTISFPCLCGTTIKRRASLLKDGMTVSCTNNDCMESFLYRHPDKSFERRSFPATCSCGNEIFIPMRYLEGLRYRRSIRAICRKCDATIAVEWRPMQAILPPS